MVDPRGRTGARALLGAGKSPTWMRAPAGLALLLLATGAGNPGGGSEGSGGVGPPQVVAWNDLGMHCIDPDFQVFSILPPFNTVNAQVVVGGQLVQQGTGFTVTYEAVADATGSINSTSAGKTNFWSHVLDLFGVALPVDVGLAGAAMPGVGNVPQPMHFDPAQDWFQAEGIPITPVDDAFEKNPYPLMRVTVRSAGGQVLASTLTVVPNSQELQCARCHASGTSFDARPAGGWVYDPNPLKDDRLNILRLHDEQEAGNPVYAASLAAAGYDAAGLHATAAGGTSILCARCHGSNALPGTGVPGVSPLTQAIHLRHAGVLDELQRPLDSIPDRAACYTCHPGLDTQCLRGAMGKAIGPDGEHSMDCQSCHGTLSDVGDPTRVGWLEQPSCQNCHTGTATLNSGQIRYTEAFDDTGELRVPASTTFATMPDVPAAGFDLYRFSSGHGGLQCSACHGPPHAIYPTDFANDNVQNELLQGHAGTLTDCATCHGTALQDDQLVGAHGMHPVSALWVLDDHGDVAEHGGLAQCQACHGVDLRGSVLSRAQADRTYASQFGNVAFWEGFEVGCYACHDGPSDESPTSNAAPAVPDRSLATPSDAPLAITLGGTDADGDALTFRIVSQPSHGTVALTGSAASYRAEAGFTGADGFTYAASDGTTDSNLGRIDVDVGAPLCGGTTEEYGFGCPGNSGVVPLLSVSGCPEPGQALTFHVQGLPPGSQALLLRGGGRGLRELGKGCVLRLDPVLGLKVFDVPPTGTGTVDVPFQVGPGLAGRTRTFQVFFREPGFGQIGRFSNAVELRIP